MNFRFEENVSMIEVNLKPTLRLYKIPVVMIPAVIMKNNFHNTYHNLILLLFINDYLKYTPLKTSFMNIIILYYTYSMV